MRWNRRVSVVLAVAVASSVAGGIAVAGGEGNQWTTAGGNRENTRHQRSEHKLSVATVDELEVKWSFTTGGDVSATPAVDGDTVYFPDWGGNLYAVDKTTGATEVEGEHPRRDRGGARQGPCDTRRHRGQGDHRDPGFDPGSGNRRARGQGARVRQVHRRAAVGDRCRSAPGVDHHAVGDGVRRPGLRRRRVAGGGARRLRPGIPVLHVPRQHVGTRRRHGRDRVEDVHGAAGHRPDRPGEQLQRQRDLGELPGDRRAARSALRRDRQQLQRAAVGARLRRRRR